MNEGLSSIKHLLFICVALLPGLWVPWRITALEEIPMHLHFSAFAKEFSIGIENDVSIASQNIVVQGMSVHDLKGKNANRIVRGKFFDNLVTAYTLENERFLPLS